MATTYVSAGVQMIALQEIRTDRNVRQQLAAEELEALAQSIRLLGQLTPVSVRPAEEGGYVLIAGHKRCAALASLGETQVCPTRPRSPCWESSASRCAAAWPASKQRRAESRRGQRPAPDVADL